MHWCQCEKCERCHKGSWKLPQFPSKAVRMQREGAKAPTQMNPFSEYRPCCDMLTTHFLSILLSHFLLPEQCLPSRTTQQKFSQGKGKYEWALVHSLCWRTEQREPDDLFHVTKLARCPQVQQKTFWQHQHRCKIQMSVRFTSACGMGWS